MRLLRTTVVAVSLVVLLAGCSLVSRPDASGWDRRAEQALDGAASEVGTARLALRAAQDDRTWSSYTTVLVADAEEAAATAEEDLAAVQVPASRDDAAASALDLLGRASTATRRVRELAVRERYDDPSLADDLARLATDLHEEAERAKARAEAS